MEEAGLVSIKKEFGDQAVERAIRAVERWQIELPTWAFGSFGGGRFSGYIPPGAARTIEEKLDDIAFVHQLTGAVGGVSTHVLWDFSADGVQPEFALARKVAQAARKRGLKLGAVSPTFFLTGFHRGSFTAPREATRKQAINQTILAGQVAAILGNQLVTLWFPDGSLYPGQVELSLAYERMREGLKACRERLADSVTLLIEYKVFEPGTYSTTIPDWGTAFALARSTGKKTGVLIDLGHHHPGTNIEQIVAILLAEGLPGGFHFNTRYAADDDQAVEPEPQLARIFYELVRKRKRRFLPENWSFMLDLACSRENRVEAILHSIDSLQITLARAC
ncbi:MAG: L-rhamnose isomerase, partial [Candidatus Omnitrophica bacterium]|nr:L-rhamnose isomerase [Candidatus Omnitrophota bacterium]